MPVFTLVVTLKQSFTTWKEKALEYMNAFHALFIMERLTVVGEMVGRRLRPKGALMVPPLL
jgi:hypothetical protein